ncbi:MAG: TIGR03620 family F420-dependent LLM class oxidoreductase [Acidimicrobiales bacterium]
MKLTGRGAWSADLRYGDPAKITEAAAELERLEYSACWIPDPGGPVFEALDRLLDATTSLVAATGVLNVWAHTSDEILAWWDGVSDQRRQRVLLGLGVSHAARIGDTWGRPLAVMNDYLDALDAGGFPVEHRCLAALGPKMLAVARDRTAGAHTYLVTPEHTAQARDILGSGGLFVEQGVVLETDPATARRIARAGLDRYVGLANYANNWKRLGFTDDDIETLDDRLVDALVAWGDADAIGERLAAHVAAGADHVCIQVIDDAGGQMPLAAWRALAPG